MSGWTPAGLESAVREIDLVLNQRETQDLIDPENIYGIWATAAGRVAHIKVADLRQLVAHARASLIVDIARTPSTLPTLEAVLEGVSYDEARTISEIGDAVAGNLAWELRGTIRNRVYELETMGLVINDGNRPSRWIRNGLLITQGASA